MVCNFFTCTIYVTSTIFSDHNLMTKIPFETACCSGPSQPTGTSSVNYPSSELQFIFVLNLRNQETSTEFKHNKFLFTSLYDFHVKTVKEVMILKTHFLG